MTWLGFAAVLLAASSGLIEAVRILAQRSNGVLFGDQALIDLASHRAASFHQVLGVYSRYGFHEPGPAIFYALAPFAVLLGGKGLGIYLGSAVISGLSCGGTAWLVVKKFGAQVALWVAGVVNIYVLCLQVRLLRQPWNPYMVVLPMVLFVVLWVVSMSHTPGAWLWLCIVGSYEVQSHVATGIVVIVMIALASGVIVALSLRERTIRSWLKGWRHPSRLLGATLLVLMWVPTTVEAIRDKPNNVVLLWRFFSAAHPTPSLHASLRMAASAIAVLPLGNQLYALTVQRSTTALGFDAAALIVLAVVTLIAGVFKRQLAAVAFVIAAMIVAVVGSYSLTRATGGALMYFALWMGVVPVAVLIGLGIAFFSTSTRSRHSSEDEPVVASAGETTVSKYRSRSQRSLTTTAAGIMALSCAVVPAWKSFFLAPAAAPSFAAAKVTAELEVAADATVKCRRGGVVDFVIGDPALWPEVAGIATTLRRLGCSTRAQPAQYDLLFGALSRSQRPLGTFHLFLTPTSAPGRRVVQVGNQVLSWAPNPVHH